MKRVLLIAGLVTLMAAWLALPSISGHAFWGHMTMHVMVVAIAAPLIAIGISNGTFDPVPQAPRVFAPIPVSLLELIVVWAWHAPLPHHLARNTSMGFIGEQAMFLMASLWLWLSACGGDSHDRSRRAAGVIGLLLTSMHMTLLGALIGLSPRSLYHHGHHSLPTAVNDQHLGGAVMLVVGGVSYLIGGLWLTYGLVSDSQGDTSVRNYSNER